MKVINRVLVLILVLGEFIFAMKFDSTISIVSYTALTIYAIQKIFQSERYAQLDNIVGKEIAMLIAENLERVDVNEENITE